MQLIIPLAGKGTRVRPYTYVTAKPLLQVAGKPVLAHILDKFAGSGLPITEAILIVGYHGEQIREFFEGYGRFTARFVEQKEMLGQAHAVLQARHLVHEDAIILFVDTLFEGDVGFLKDVREDGVIFASEVEDPRRFGQVKHGEDGIVTDFAEKADPPVSNLVNIGFYYIKDTELMFRCIDEQIDRGLKTKGEYFLPDTFKLMLEKGTRFRVAKVDAWLDAGVPDTVLGTNRYLLEHGHAGVQEGATVEGCVIRDPVSIKAGAVCTGSVIGPGVSVGNARVEDCFLEDTIVEDGVSVKDIIVKHAILGDNTRTKGNPKSIRL
ncbi:NTP transferase domain-containing protein [Candidatus Woesearchaeota archaeon]|nr:NTP transferase domain-containing protein [Candidatus Woesearchaeota archaeon]